MSDESSKPAGTGTVRLHRVIRTKPERVYRAFLDGDAMVKWLPPHGFTGKILELDVRPGGRYRMSFTNFGTGSSEVFGGSYLEMKENELLRYTDVFENPALPGEMITTVKFRAAVCGTELDIVQEGIPAAIPVAACCLGWQESLNQLADLVEPDIPDGA